MTLPNFIIIGAARSGTTSLYHYLGEHPDVFVSAVKETNFFAYRGQPDRDFRVHTLEQYEALFAGAGDARAIGEASPSYLNVPGTAERMREQLPDARLLAVLRHPAERAFSAYLMRVRGDGRERERRAIDAAFAPDAPFVRNAFCFERLKDYFDAFPHDRIRVHLYEELSREPRRVLAASFAFLDVDPAFAPDLSQRYNAGWVPRNAPLNAALKSRRLRRIARSLVRGRARRLFQRAASVNSAEAPAMPPELHARLTDLYREEIERLQGLLQRDLSAWLEREPSEARG